MTKINKRGLAICVAAALALPATAMAASFTMPTGTNVNYASNIFSATNQAWTPNATATYTTHVTDNIVGRTTGFGVRLTLTGGATFTAAPPVAFTANVINYTAGAPTVGTGPLANVATFPMQANAGANILVGDFLTVNPFTISGAAALANGGQVGLRIEIFDSNTNAVLSDLTRTITLINATEGTTVTFAPSLGDVNKRIDVTSCATQTPAAQSKSQFSPTGNVGDSCGPAAGAAVFNAGSITHSITTVGGNPVLANGFGGDNNTNPGNWGNFRYAAGDEVTYTVSGVDFAAFDSGVRIYMSTTSNCAYSAATSTPLVINAAKTAATGTYEHPAATTGATQRFVCFAAHPTRLTQMVAQGLSASVDIDFADANVGSPATRLGALLPLRYNGTVMSFQNVNPASNPRAQSFLRFTNNGPITCPVTLTGRDDNGVAGTSAITFDLASGKSATFNSEDLEGGSSKGTGAFGDGAGRWWVNATGACGGLVGSALNRNVEDGTVTNLTPQNHGTNL